MAFAVHRRFCRGPAGAARGPGKKLRLAVAYLLDPAAFETEQRASPARPLTGDQWDLPEIGIAGLRVHPRHLVGGDYAEVTALWRRCRERGMGGAAPLPYAGGAADQPAWLMGALDIMDAAYAALTKKPGSE